MTSKKIIVKSPATAANLGSGFDCLAIALDIFNTVSVEIGEQNIQISGEGENELPNDETNLIYRMIKLVMDKWGYDIPRLTITCDNKIPISRGLGSSSSAIISGLLIGNELSGRQLVMKELLDLGSEVEGHSDNIAATLYGGFQIVVQDKKLNSNVVIPKDLTAVLYIPKERISTDEARSVLPDSLGYSDVIYNLGRVALLINAFNSGNLNDLKIATEDKLHQKYRQTIFPSMRLIIDSAINAGAYGAFLSGSGSTIFALCKGKEMTIAYEMLDAASKVGILGDTLVTKPSLIGSTIDIL
ncbi:MAG: homoserine kinase [SAR202 cluster bacterium]|nr:homoserine kinase [SAR202 cluster bacterium]|tara:strand:- start:42591 stop:43490 length:900 start_codon:yes stop_codon:yes gene_type:complete